MRGSLLLQRYLNFALIKNFILIFVFVCAIVLSNNFFFVLNDLSNEFIYDGEIASLIFLRFFSDISLVLTLSFFISFLSVLYDFNRNSEFIALSFAGVVFFKITFFLRLLIVAFIFLISYLALFIEPELNKNYFNLKYDIQERPIHLKLKERKFYELEDVTSIYFSSIDDTNSARTLYEDFMLYSSIEGKLVISKKAFIHNVSSKEIVFTLIDGQIFENLIRPYQNVKVSNFKNYQAKIDIKVNDSRGEKSLKLNTKKTLELVNSPSNINKAELFWRFSKPISLILLIYLTFLATKINVRTSKTHPMIYGIVAFILVYYLNTSLKSLIEIHDLNGILILILLSFPLTILWAFIYFIEVKY